MDENNEHNNTSVSEETKTDSEELKKSSESDVVEIAKHTDVTANETPPITQNENQKTSTVNTEETINTDENKNTSSASDIKEQSGNLNEDPQTVENDETEKTEDTNETTEAYGAEMMEEVNINEHVEISKTSEDIEKENECDPMDTIDHIVEEKHEDDEHLDHSNTDDNVDGIKSKTSDDSKNDENIEESHDLDENSQHHDEEESTHAEEESTHAEEESTQAEEESTQADEERSHSVDDDSNQPHSVEDDSHIQNEIVDDEGHIQEEDETEPHEKDDLPVSEEITDANDGEKDTEPVDENVEREEPVDDIHEGEGADEEVSLLPEREITEADKERALAVAAVDEETPSADENNVKDAVPNESQDTNNAENIDENIQQVQEDEEEPEPVVTTDPSGPKDFEIQDDLSHTKSVCVWCKKEKNSEFMYTEKEETKYICSMACITKLRTENPEQFTVNLRKIPIITILETKQTCTRCKKKKICNYRFKNDEKIEYLCEQNCLNTFIGNGERYVLKKKRYLIDDSTTETEQKCIQCSETKVCKYSFKQEEDELFICHEDCLNLLLKEQPEKIRVKRRSVRVRELPLRSGTNTVEELQPLGIESTKIIARSEKEAEEAKLDRENSFVRRCVHCTTILEDHEKLLSWETLDFCNEICLGQYQNVIGSKCAFCNKAVSLTSLGKYCVRFGYEIKQFCRSACLDEYKKGLKVCSYCQQDISAGQQGFLASVGDKGQFKDFCTQSCMKKYDEMCNPKKKSDVSLCAVCNNDKPVRVEVQLDGKTHKFCSNPCFSAFKFVNNVYPDLCEMCQKYFERKSDSAFTIYQNSSYKMFCTKICMNIFIITNRKIVPCNWCKVKKYNFDMITKMKNSQAMLMCSLNCLTLCEVSMNAVSMTTLKCDQCDVLTIPQYLLSMSDASIRNFCTYQCVMAFQSQFSKAPLILEGEPANSLPIPTGLPKRVRKDTYANLQNQGGGAQSKSNSSRSINKSNVQSKQSSLPIITNVTSLASGGAGISTRSTRSRKPSPPAASSQKSSQSKQNQQKGGQSKPTISAIPLQNLKVSLERMNTDFVKKPTSTRTTRSQHSAEMQDDSSSRPSTPLYDAGYNESPRSPVVEVKTQVVVVPPIPKPVYNMGTMCKPIMQTKGVTCRPQSVSVECQTEDHLERKLVIPIPVPIFIPQPMYMYSLPTPIPVPMPLPIPVPVFIPTTRNSANGIMKEIKKIQDKMPTDPFEAELLMMAEMVAGDKKKSDSDSGSDDDGNDEDFNNDTIENSNAFGEDMLQMALKMASEYDEPAVDLESAMPSNTITPNAHPHIPNEELVDDPAMQHHHMILMEQQRQLSTRGRKRGSGAQNRNNRNNISGTQNPNKKPRREITQIIEPQPEPPREPQEKADANMCLKFTFGVNAWKQWVMTKNADLEKSSIRRKPFKSDLLQLTADELNYSLCLFVKEVRKPNGSEYAPDTIYYLVLGIQQYLYEHGRIDNIFTDIYYERFTDCLDEVARKFSVLYNDSQYIVTRVEEEHLWECKQLGAHSPHVLLSTLMFFNTKHFNLTTVDEHMQLSFSHIMKHWKRNPNQPGAAKSAGSRNVLLRFYPPQSTIENNARKKKVYEQQENEENPLRCPVKLYEFYLSKCPESVKTRSDVFYLQPERSCVPDSPVWYSTQALSREALSKMLHRVKMVKEINIALLTS